ELRAVAGPEVEGAVNYRLMPRATCAALTASTGIAGAGPARRRRRSRETRLRTFNRRWRGGYSFSRGISSARLHGCVRRSSCGPISLSHPVAHAFDEPGRQKTYVAFATPATQRDCRLDGPISSYEIVRNSSPKPSIVLSSSGRTASGVPSRPVSPVPPAVLTT